MKTIAVGSLLTGVLMSPAALAAEPWPMDVPGHVAIQPGEHPRLLFRRSDLPELRERAKTPEGQAILKRLRETLNGGDGESMPENLGMQGQASKDGSGEFAQDPAGKVYSISHVAGYGFLYQITGGQRFSGPRDLAVDPNGYILLAARFGDDTGLAWLDFDGRFINTVRRL